VLALVPFGRLVILKLQLLRGDARLGGPLLQRSPAETGVDSLGCEPPLRDGNGRQPEIDIVTARVKGRRWP